MSSVEIREEPGGDFEAYAGVSIAFSARAILTLEAVDGGLGGLRLEERAVAPFVKDYDALEHPRKWPRRFDLSGWGGRVARQEGERVGGAVIAHDTPGLDRLAGRRELAALWDLRVLPARRGQGIGRALFRAAEAWAGARGCTALEVETQNTNLAACRFYARQGCTLSCLRRFAYPQLPEEIELVWRKALVFA